MTRAASAYPTFLVAAILATSPNLFATVVIQPGPEDGKDISLYERTDLPLSSGTSLYTINTGPPGPGRDDFTSLVEFDLSGVSASADSVTSAHLWLYENNVETFSFQHVTEEFPNTIEVQPAATAWEEEGLFYSTLPEPVPGYSATQLVSSVNQWYSWDVTDVVRDWLSGLLDNNGFLITSQIEVRDGFQVVGSAFASSEQSNPPYLEMEFMNVQPGDFDQDGDVDGTDFLNWQREYGMPAVPFGTGADGNSDGMVDVADYDLWRENFGFNLSSGGGAAIAIPEPSTPAMLALAVAVAVISLRTLRVRAGAMYLAVALMCVLSVQQSSHALTVPFTEDFPVDGANWREVANAPVNYISSGGMGGENDGYISVDRTFTANPDFSQTIFRGHDGFDSSGDAFVGNWLSGDVTRFSFWVRHNAATDLTFGTRFATSANTPGANGIGSPDVIPSNVWSLVQLPISPANIIPEGPPSLFDTVFGAVGNLQITARPGTNLNTPITFDLDRVSIVPEPSTWGLLSVVGFALALIQWRGRLVNNVFSGTILGIVFLAAGTVAAQTESLANQSLTPLPEPLASFGAASHQGWLYVYGGHVGETHDHSRENVRGSFRRQPLTGGDWQELPGGPAVQSPALVAHGDFLYRIGGLTAYNAPDEPSHLRSIDSVARFNPETNTWKPLPGLPEPRSSHDAVVMGDYIYVAGGWSHHGEEGEAKWLETTLVLDLSMDYDDLHWREIAAPFKRRALALATFDNRIYCIGGMNRDTSCSRRVDVYDPHFDSWSRGPDLPESDLNGFGASAFEVGGRLYASSRSELLLVLESDGALWAPAASLHPPRFFHRILPGPNSSVLLIGGADEESHLATIQVVSTNSNR